MINSPICSTRKKGRGEKNAEERTDRVKVAQKLQKRQTDTTHIQIHIATEKLKAEREERATVCVCVASFTFENQKVGEGPGADLPPNVFKGFPKTQPENSPLKTVTSSVSPLAALSPPPLSFCLAVFFFEKKFDRKPMISSSAFQLDNHNFNHQP